MRRLAAWAPVVLVALLAAGAAPPQGRRPASTPVPAPDSEETPTPTPTPGPPRFLGGLESAQGDGSDRVAVFADGTVSRTVRWKGRRVARRLTLSREELDVVRRILSDALAATDAETPRGDVLTGGSERRMTMEIAVPGEAPRFFRFDDSTALPLAAGRARGALEDLRARFDEKAPVGEARWNVSGVAIGDRLRRKSDGRWFVVVRDDSFERNLELRSEEEQGLVVWLGRSELPSHFHDPALPSPEPAPAEPPR